MSVSTNKAVYVAYRGPWAVETWVRDRLLDIAANELGMDRAELRRKNMVLGAQGDRLPTGVALEGVVSLESLDRALASIGYEAFLAEQKSARRET